MSIATKTGNSGTSAPMFNRRISKTDILRRLIENLILSHLIPVHGGFPTHQEIKNVSFTPKPGDAPVRADATA